LHIPIRPGDAKYFEILGKMMIFFLGLISPHVESKTNPAHSAHAGQEPSSLPSSAGGLTLKSLPPKLALSARQRLVMDEVPAPAEITMLGQIKKSL